MDIRTFQTGAADSLVGVLWHQFRYHQMLEREPFRLTIRRLPTTAVNRIEILPRPANELEGFSRLIRISSRGTGYVFSTPRPISVAGSIFARSFYRGAIAGALISGIFATLGHINDNNMSLEEVFINGGKAAIVGGISMGIGNAIGTVVASGIFLPFGSPLLISIASISLAFILPMVLSGTLFSLGCDYLNVQA
ncbi:MAG: hypothetical protein COS89_05210 [Deltaproteobacteria bacterium CG07_land_8_20_14_0_80_38_7]|nr:MAG: hypothetical protein COS89_05210 [Deltaproteobacteria bacterium CG07_land_8_20_14_0_80_38_7]